jgi:predicted hotdog family 3-hydroxylacyl-ACP dehydratase
MSGGLPDDLPPDLRPPFGREPIRALVPHAGAMCLLAGVRACDARRIECWAGGLGDPAHPLRSADGLHALHLIEYAAQAAAVHGALCDRAAAACAARAARGGMLVAVREVALAIEWLHPLRQPLEIAAERLLELRGGWIYRFDARCGGHRLAGGRVSVVTADT